jgi:transposase
VWRELSALGFDVRLVDPAQAKALRGGIKRAKTDRLDARWLCMLLAKEMLPESWLPPAEIQTLRDQTRLRKALAEDRTRWAQRLHPDPVGLRSPRRPQQDGQVDEAARR